MKDLLQGAPKWADTSMFDVVAKAPASEATIDMENVAPMLIALLKERFLLAWHTEERPVPAYSLVAVKPKMKKADPASRTSCKFPSPSPMSGTSSMPTRTMVCQNVTMAQLAEQLRGSVPGSALPILDATSLDGCWDFTLTWNPRAGMAAINAGGGRGGAEGAAAADAPAASDPTAGYSLIEAVEKELGLKLESQKRPMQVFVIDHLEEKPTEN